MRKGMLSRRLVSAIAAIILIVVIAAPVLASPAIATRTLSPSVTSGAEFDVAIEALGCGIFGQVVETLPSGFTYLSCTASDIGVEQIGNIVKFTFLGDSASFTYTVKAPTVAATTTYTFRGIVKDENKNEYPIEDNDIAVTASVPPPETYTLTILVDGNGSTTPSAGSHTCDADTVLDIIAIADSGWQFDNWDGDVANPSSSSTTVPMDADKTVIANFVEIPPGVYTLRVACNPSEGGSVTLSPAAEDNQYEDGTSVKLVATPSDGYAFDGWSGDLSSSTNPTSMTIDSHKNITANFVPESGLGGSASFSASHLNISPKQVQPNRQVNISIDITNNGGNTGSYEAVLYVNGQLEDSRILEIFPGSTQTVVFSITKATPRTYTVSLGEQQGQFAIVDSQSASGEFDIVSMIAIVVIVAFIAALVFVFRRIKKGA